MLCAVIAPELVIIWAMRQWCFARRVAKRYRVRNWSMTHGFFIQMGGFMLCWDGKEVSPLTLEEMELLYSRGTIDFPDITQRQIEDKSKGDGLSKSLVVLQTLWFVVQCVARAISGMVITELELVTLGFAVLNGVLYFLWWNKPLNVQCPVPVHRKAPPPSYILRGQVVDHHEASKFVEMVEVENVSRVPGKSRFSTDFARTPEETRRDAMLSQPSNDTLAGSIHVQDHWPPPQGSAGQMSSLSRAIKRAAGAVRFVVFSAFVRPMSDMIGSGEATSVKPEAKRVPTFHAREVTPTESFAMGFTSSTLATIFGGIHCIAWSFSFPTVVERTIWRIASLAITSIPFIMLALFFLLNFGYSHDLKMSSVGQAVRLFVDLATFIVVMIYVISRLILLVQAFLALRALSPGAYDAIQWTHFVPHL